ncbi:hypothetical protein [Arcticibacter sp. MXS-1]|uniref:hypothetical protein n=1 Tax=Arcticibacter sp. MXS-1 TaxID=3341726 RepID=UPI0035A82E5B
MTLPEFRPYTFIDFTNTSESLCLIMIYSMVGVVFDLPISYIPVVTAVLLLAEVLTTGFRAMLAPGKVSPLVVFEMLAHKNAYELGMLWGASGVAELPILPGAWISAFESLIQALFG